MLEKIQALFYKLQVCFVFSGNDLVSVPFGFALWFAANAHFASQLSLHIFWSFNCYHADFNLGNSCICEIPFQCFLVRSFLIHEEIWVSFIHLIIEIQYWQTHISFFRAITFNYMMTVLKDIYHGREWSEMPKEDMIFIHKIAFVESISEATLQLILSCLILRSYGISNDAFSMFTQIFSFVTSLLSIVFAFKSVSN